MRHPPSCPRSCQSAITNRQSVTSTSISTPKLLPISTPTSINRHHPFHPKKFFALSNTGPHGLNHPLSQTPGNDEPSPGLNKVKSALLRHPSHPFRDMTHSRSQEEKRPREEPRSTTSRRRRKAGHHGTHTGERVGGMVVRSVGSGRVVSESCIGVVSSSKSFRLCRRR